jgi:hypothetical protein
MYRLLVWSPDTELWQPTKTKFDIGREDWIKVQEAQQQLPGSIIAYLPEK